MKEETAKLKAKLRTKSNPQAIDWTKALSSGLTLLNLAVTGRTDACFLPGHYYLFVGDSQAGKTWLLLTAMAEAANSEAYCKHRLILDNPERGALMDYWRYFGSRLADHLEPASRSGPSKTIEDFYDHVDDAVGLGEPFFYGLDSEDALSSEAERKKFAKDKKTRFKISVGDDDEGQIKGSYGDGKAKKNSQMLRVAHNSLADSGSILAIVKQTRDNIGFDAMFNPKTRSGGRALTFYATCEFWFSVKGKIKKTVRGEKRIVGSVLKIHVKKNRIAGRDWAVEIPFFPSVGFDDTGSMIDFLVKEKHWNKSSDDPLTYKLVAPEFDFDGSREKLVHLIENDEREPELKDLVSEVWTEIEEACKVRRKPKYA